MPLVDEATPGTAYLGCCLNCSRKLGEEHRANCEFVTGEDDPNRHGGLLGARLIQLKVQRYFDDDSAKTMLWFRTKNPMLGDVSPFEMIDSGRLSKLVTFIDGQLSEKEKKKDQS